MTDEDYKALLKQAEDELVATLGAYCSRKAALRALELLRAAGQQEFSEVDKRITEHRKTIDQYINRCAEQARIIEQQAQAIRRLEEEKMRGGLSQQRNPSMGLGIVEQLRRTNNVFNYEQERERQALNSKFDNAGRWK